MQIEFLAAQGFSQRTIANWKAQGITSLLPLQVEAVTRTRLMQGSNVVVFAPTSSGKTLVAELAAVRQWERGGKAVFLVPTKALAEQQFEYLDKMYGGSLGARVVIATRERTLHDARILRGDFDFAVMVYEKLKAFLTLSPELLSRISMVAVDELQILGEPGRGDVVDLLLTRIVNAAAHIQVVCLSAVLAENLRLASWLKAESLTFRERPTELREGVFCLADSRFYYRECNSGEESDEALLAIGDGPVPGYGILPDAQSFQYPAVEVMCSAMVRRGEQVLVFVPTRDLSRKWAYRLANALPVRTGADAEPNDFQEAEESHSRELLERCLQSGVAFHNADLGAELRAIVEEQFAAGRVRVLVATSTLAQGVNLNCRNVISVPLMMDPGATAPSARPAFVPLSTQRFRNQGGRAGRLCSGEPFGRSILIAEDDAELQRMWKQYVLKDVEPLEPCIEAQGLGRLALDMIHNSGATTMDALEGMLLQTYSAAIYWDAQPGKLRVLLEDAVQRLATEHLVQEQGGRLSATGLGQIAAAFGLQSETVKLFAQYSSSAGTAVCSELEVLALCAFCADGELFPVGVTKREALDQYFPRLLRLRYGSLVYAVPEKLRALLAPDGGFSHAGMCALKKIFLADAWLSTEPTHSIEEQYKTFSGTFTNLGTHFSWLAQALASCMATLGCAAEAVEQVAQIAERLAWGTSSAGLPVARLGVRAVTRTHVQQLVRGGYDTAEAVVEVDAARLSPILPERVAQALICAATKVVNAKERSSGGDWFTIMEQWNAAQQEAAAGGANKRTPTGGGAAMHADDAPYPIAAEQSAKYAVSPAELAIDPRSPGEFEFRQQRIKLTPKPFQLLCLLAQNPGRTIPYDEIDAALNPDCKVERQQLSAHKNVVVRALADVCGRDEAESLIVSVPRFGIRLEMDAARIQIGKLRAMTRPSSSRRDTSAGAAAATSA